MVVFLLVGGLRLVAYPYCRPTCSAFDWLDVYGGVNISIVAYLFSWLAAGAIATEWIAICASTLHWVISIKFWSASCRHPAAVVTVPHGGLL